MSVNFQQGGRYGKNSKICLLLLIPTSSIHWNEAKRVLLRFESQLRGASQIHPFHTPNVKYLQWCPQTTSSGVWAHGYPQIPPAPPTLPLLAPSSGNRDRAASSFGIGVRAPPPVPPAWPPSFGMLKGKPKPQKMKGGKLWLSGLRGCQEDASR